MRDDKIKRLNPLILTVKLAKVAVTWGFFESTVDESLRLTAADGTDSKETGPMVVRREIRVSTLIPFYSKNRIVQIRFFLLFQSP